MSLEKQINEQLKSIKPSGLLTASKMANDNLKKVNLFLDLASKKQCLNCSNKQCTNLVMPIITENSDVLFIFSTLDEYDMTTHSFYGKGSRLLYSCIPALNIEKYSVTSVVKCGNLSASAFENCYSYYLSRELDLIKPKKIVCFGANASNIIKSYFIGDNNYFNNDDDCKGTYTIDDINILFTNDINRICTYSEEEMTKRKKQIWNDLSNFIK